MWIALGSEGCGLCGFPMQNPAPVPAFGTPPLTLQKMTHLQRVFHLFWLGPFHQISSPPEQFIHNNLYTHWKWRTATTCPLSKVDGFQMFFSFHTKVLCNRIWCMYTEYDFHYSRRYGKRRTWCITSPVSKALLERLSSAIDSVFLPLDDTGDPETRWEQISTRKLL